MLKSISYKLAAITLIYPILWGAGVPRVLAQQTYIVQLSGASNTQVPGFVPHGDPLLTGFAELTIYSNNTMDYHIVLEGNRYEVTQAHLYNIHKTASGTLGDSIICWGGRWANGGNSSDFLIGNGYFNGRLSEVVADPTNWYLMLHTEGGHFANDELGGLISYDSNRSGPQETSVVGVPEAERPGRFNNRVGKTLLDTVLRVDNTNDPAAPYYNPTAPSNQNPTLFADSLENMWVQSDGQGGWQLTTEAIARGYDLTTEYLFYLYDDQGPSWDYGGPEGAAGGFLGQSVTHTGDLNLDGSVDSADWLKLMEVYGSDLTGLSPLSAYFAGDLNRDGVHSLADIQWLRSALAAGAGSHSSLGMDAVPEPHSQVLVAIVCAALLAIQRGRAPGLSRP